MMLFYWSVACIIAYTGTLEQQEEHCAGECVFTFKCIKTILKLTDGKRTTYRKMITKHFPHIASSFFFFLNTGLKLYELETDPF